MGKVTIEARVLRGIEYVEKYGGLDTMLDFKRVCHLCRIWGYQKTADWILANKEDYSQGVGHGFESLPDENPEGGLAKVGDFFPDELKNKGANEMARAVRIKDLGNGKGYALDLNGVVFPSRRQAQVVKAAIDGALVEAERFERQAFKAIKATAEFLEIPEADAAKKLGVDWGLLIKEEQESEQKIEQKPAQKMERQSKVEVAEQK